MYNFDSYNVLLSIATNIPVLLMTAFVLQGHIFLVQCHAFMDMYQRTIFLKFDLLVHILYMVVIQYHGLLSIFSRSFRRAVSMSSKGFRLRCILLLHVLRETERMNYASQTLILLSAHLLFSARIQSNYKILIKFENQSHQNLWQWVILIISIHYCSKDWGQ